MRGDQKNTGKYISIIVKPTNKIFILEPGDMAQWLRALAALPKDWVKIPSPHMVTNMMFSSVHHGHCMQVMH